MQAQLPEPTDIQPLGQADELGSQAEDAVAVAVREPNVAEKLLEMGFEPLCFEVSAPVQPPQLGHCMIAAVKVTVTTYKLCRILISRGRAKCSFKRVWARTRLFHPDRLAAQAIPIWL